MFLDSIYTVKPFHTPNWGLSSESSELQHVLLPSLIHYLPAQFLLGMTNNTATAALLSQPQLLPPWQKGESLATCHASRPPSYQTRKISGGLNPGEACRWSSAGKADTWEVAVAMPLMTRHENLGESQFHSQGTRNVKHDMHRSGTG